jgi:hypothetical protein
VKAGKRTKEWQEMRELLKPAFAAVHITRCEFRYRGCWHDNALGFAHIKKRANLKPNELSIVALACNPCHDLLELLPEAEMEWRVKEVIAQRVLQPAAVGVT